MYIGLDISNTLQNQLHDVQECALIRARLAQTKAYNNRSMFLGILALDEGGDLRRIELTSDLSLRSSSTKDCSRSK